jgi:hypothetical protein
LCADEDQPVQALRDELVQQLDDGSSPAVAHGDKAPQVLLAQVVSETAGHGVRPPAF